MKTSILEMRFRRVKDKDGNQDGCHAIAEQVLLLGTLGTGTRVNVRVMLQAAYRTRTVSASCPVRNLWWGFAPQTGLTFITHHQVMMGEGAETLLRQNIQARTPSLLTDS